MNTSEAISLAYSLSSRHEGVTVSVDFGGRDLGPGAAPIAPRIVFESAATGTHSIDVFVSDTERVLAHFDGFVAKQPEAKREAREKEALAVVAAAPVVRVGKTVSFEHRVTGGSLRVYTGTVLKVGRTRALIRFERRSGAVNTSYIQLSRIVASKAVSQ